MHYDLYPAYPCPFFCVIFWYYNIKRSVYILVSTITAQIIVQRVASTTPKLIPLRVLRRSHIAARPTTTTRLHRVFPKPLWNAMSIWDTDIYRISVVWDVISLCMGRFRCSATAFHHFWRSNDVCSAFSRATRTRISGAAPGFHVAATARPRCHRRRRRRAPFVINY